MLVLAIVPVILYQLLGQKWVALPWSLAVLLGTAASFIVGPGVAPRRRVIRAVLCSTALLLLGCETASRTPGSSQSRAQPGITLSGEGGSSVEQPAVIIGAPGSPSGIGAGSNWLAQRYPGYKRRSQAVITVGQRTYEQLEIETADGQLITLYFDITVFFQERK